jgi:hypothetical protein
LTSGAFDQAASAQCSAGANSTAGDRGCAWRDDRASVRACRRAKLQAAIIEEAGERGPTLEAVIDGLAGVAVLGHPGALLAQPILQFDDERPAALGAHAHTLLWRQAVDLALDGKQRMDARNRLASNGALLAAEA